MFGREKHIMVPDASVEALFDARRNAPKPDYATLSVETARSSFAAAQAATVLEKPEMAEIIEVEDSWNGEPLRLRVYRPSLNAELQAALIYFHGGGWVLGSIESHDHICRTLAAKADVVVIAVDYPLAPESRYPCAVLYGLNAINWVFANVDALGLDRQRIAVGGDSAGGNLAAVMALHARNGDLPRLAAQVLLYPVLDLTMSGASYDDPHPDLSITGAAMDWYIGHYLPDRRLAENWQASPYFVESVVGLCPSFILTAGCDVVAWDGMAYADRLGEAGVPVVEKRYPGQIHAFLALPHLLPEADHAFCDVANYLKAQLSIGAVENVAAETR